MIPKTLETMTGSGKSSSLSAKRSIDRKAITARKRPRQTRMGLERDGEWLRSGWDTEDDLAIKTYLHP
jgi:hypothetical protein